MSEHLEGVQVAMLREELRQARVAYEQAISDRDSATAETSAARGDLARWQREADERRRRDDLTLLRVLELFTREQAHHARVAAAVVHSATDSGESNVEALAGLCLASLDDTDAARDFHRAAASARVRRAAERALDLRDVAEYCAMGLNSSRAGHWEAALYDIAGVVRLSER